MKVNRPSPKELAALGRRDRALGRAMRKLAPFPGFPTGETRRDTHYETLSRAIVYQQLAGKAAATIHKRVCALSPGSRFPAPEQIVKLSEEVKIANFSFKTIYLAVKIIDFTVYSIYPD